MFSTITVLILAIIAFRDSLQSCSSTVAITTCTWDTLRSTKPLQIDDYKTYLSFSKGNLDSIPDGAFKFFPQVTNLQLSNNKIRNLEERSLEGLVSLKQLSLYDNQLTAVDERDLKACEKLEKLDLGMNKISFVHEKAFEHLFNLQYLNLAFNSLKACPSALNTLRNLRVLKLDNNAINALRANAFSSLTKLEELFLNDNKLAKIEQHSFQGLIKMKRLDLRSNFLTDLNVGDLIGDVSGLNVISLSINDFKCDILGKILEEFERRGVQVTRGVTRNSNNVNGISCKIS